MAMLRGINVGGKHRLPMKDLVELSTSAGAEEVSTYIQSGNVVFTAAPAIAKRIGPEVAAAIENRFRFSSPVVIRSAKEMAAVVGDNPFLAEGIDPSTLHVAFLLERPRAAAVAALDPDRSPGDRFEVRGRDVFLHLPNGVARSKLTNAWLDRALGTVSTARNWKTVTKLLELAGG